MTEYFLKKDVLGIIQAGIVSYDDLLSRGLIIDGKIYTTRDILNSRKKELENLCKIFDNRVSFKFE